MDLIKRPEQINHHRRRFLGSAAMTLAAAQFVLSGSADAQSSKAKPADLPRINPGANKSFGPLKQIDAGLLNVGYAETGPVDGPSRAALGTICLRKRRKPLPKQSSMSTAIDRT